MNPSISTGEAGSSEDISFRDDQIRDTLGASCPAKSWPHCSPLAVWGKEGSATLLLASRVYTGCAGNEFYLRTTAWHPPHLPYL